MSRTAVVIVCSTRAAAGRYPDRTGPVLVDWLAGRGFAVGPAVVVPDGPEVLAALQGALHADLVVTTGGTGVTPTDGTPEATAAVLDYEIPGLAEALRREGVEKVPTAVLSRGRVGVAGRTLVVNLPGSSGGVKDGIVVLERVLDHTLAQLTGADHVSADRTEAPGESAADPPEVPFAGPAPGVVGEPATTGSTEPAPAELELALAEPTPADSSLAGRVARAEVSDAPLSLSEYADAVADPAAGATVTFAGVVRDHDGGRGVTGLDYEAHPSAGAVVTQVAAEVAGYPGVIAVAVSHRYGSLAVGDIALAAAVSAAHRRAAFDACAALVDLVKQRIPIWKRQSFTDGSDEWVGSA